MYALQHAGAGANALSAHEQRGVRVVCISDTHGSHARVRLPEGEVLVHAGDITANGTEDDLHFFLDWFSQQDFLHRLFIAGNHDTFLEREPERSREIIEASGVVYLNDSGIDLEGVRFWGSPVTPRFLDWSFMRDPGPDIRKHWTLIPENTDVLITHGPPRRILDKVERAGGTHEHAGCISLLAHVRRVRPRYHVFGHIHEEFGIFDTRETRFLNVSTMNKYYRIANEPVCFDLIAQAR